MPEQPGSTPPQLSLPDPGHAGPQLALMLEPDLKSMHLRIGQDGKLMAGIVLTTDNLDGLVASLTQIRGRMLPVPAVAAAQLEPAPATAASEPAQPEPAPTEFSPNIAREIKGTHYDFGLSDTGQQLIFSVRDEGLGLDFLSLRRPAARTHAEGREFGEEAIGFTPPSPVPGRKGSPRNAGGC